VQAELDQSKKWFPRGKGVVIPCLIDLSPFRHAPGPALARAKWPALSERPSVLLLSRLHYKKGPEVLLRAMKLVAQRGLDCNTVLAGSGEEAYVDSLRKLADEVGLKDRVLFTGQVGGN